MQDSRRTIVSGVSINEIDYEKENILGESDFLYTTHFWVDYLIEHTGGKPILIEISYNNKNCFFIGIIFKKFGFKLCGSPFEGWSTPYMGFLGLNNIPSDNDKNTIIKATIKYLSKIKNCVYLQICDWNISVEFAKKNKYKYEIHSTYYLDISPKLDDLFSSFKTDVRTNCRNFLKRGAKLYETAPTKEFANNYYQQLVKVFEKQKLQAFYSKERIEKLFSFFEKKKDYIFCENVVDPDEKQSIATGIFFGYKKRCYFFGAASYKEFQILRPNEYVIWNAIKYWKSKGCTEFDMLGIRKYKEKFCPSLVERPIIYYSKFPLLHPLKKLFKSIVSFRRKKRT